MMTTMMKRTTGTDVEREGDRLTVLKMMMTVCWRLYNGTRHKDNKEKMLKEYIIKGETLLHDGAPLCCE